jgi:hypothetical protein
MEEETMPEQVYPHIYTDEFDRDVVDVTEYYVDIIGDSVKKAERREEDVLILIRDKGERKYHITHYWLTRKEAELCEVLGDDYTWWKPSEVDLNKPLFKQFSVCG